MDGLEIDRVKANITGDFRVPRENYNGRRTVEFCAETHFQNKSLHKYTRVARGKME